MELIEKLEKYFFEEYPLRRLLKNTKQDKIHHQEGDVWTHTKLVLQNMMEDTEFQDMDDNNQQILLMSALLHDIAKPFSSREERGRIKTPNHASNGELEARKIFYKHNFMEDIFGKIDFKTREEVCSLVRYHGLPVFLNEKNDYKDRIIKISFETTNKKLAILSRADAKGRICNDQDEFIHRVDFFIEEAKKLECYENKRAFVDEKSKMFYFIYGDNYLYYSPFGGNESNVTILSGIPGAGKTTYINENFKNKNIISLDDIRKKLKISPSKNQGQVVQVAKEIAKKLLADKKDFVWDATNTTRTLRKSLIKIFADYNANINIIYIETDYKELIKRNNTRINPIPEDIIEKLINKLQPPKDWECMNVKNVISIKK